MKKIVINSLLFAVTAGLLFMTSCKDKFTEEDLLNAQQEMDYTVLVYNANSEISDSVSQAGIADATVTINQAGKEKSKETDEAGNAIFTGVKIGQVVVKVEAEGFTKVTFTADLTTWNAKIGQATTIIPVFATTSGSMATIKGKAEIETDLTNNTPELVPAGTKISVMLEFDDLDDVLNYVNWPGSEGEINSLKYQTFSGTVDDNGMYSISVPTIQQGMPIRVYYPVLTLDQTLAYAGLDDYYGTTYPEDVVPSTGSISTTFGYSGAGTATVPGINAVFATVDDYTADSVDQAKLTVTINSDGEVASIAVSEPGGSYPESDTIDVTITSLSTGSGATAEAHTTGFGSINDVVVKTEGSGYPYDDDLVGQNGNINYCYYQTYTKSSDWGLINGTGSNVPAPNNAGLTITPGVIINGNIYYGVGTTRAQEVNTISVP